MIQESLSAHDRSILRDLAKRVAEIASLSVQEERVSLWKRHNALEHVGPMILVFPEGSWAELLPEASLVCEDDEAREMERALRRCIFYHERMEDDTVIKPGWNVPRAVGHTGWGVEPRYVPATESRGAWKFDPVIRDASDMKKLTHPEVIYDEDETARRFERACDVFDGIFDVRLKGVAHVSFHLMSIWCKLHGLEETMTDMALNPSLVHDAMAFLEEGYRGMVKQWESMNLLDLNNDGTYHSSGGVGYTDEIPRDGFDPDHVRPRDMWSSAESQELAQVSPAMHREFVIPYESRLLEPFALTGYGCCEDLTRKMDFVLKLPNIRRISVAPSADVEACARQIGEKAIFSWKPNPAHLVGDFNESMIRDTIRRALDATRGCIVEMILKDTHTCEHKPERFTRWTEIAREEVEKM